MRRPKLKLRFNFKKAFYKFIVLAGVAGILHVGYIEFKGHCVKKATMRQIVAIMIPTICYNSACEDAVYKSLDEQKKNDVCRYINFGD